MDLCKIPQSLISLISASAHSLSALLNNFFNGKIILMIYTNIVIYCLFDFPLQPPLALMLLLSHSCLTFTFPCWLSHRIDNKGLSGCQDNRIGLHRDHMNGNVDWTWVTLCLAIANTNNAGTHEYVKDCHSESPQLPQNWGRKIKSEGDVCLFCHEKEEVFSMTVLKWVQDNTSFWGGFCSAESKFYLSKLWHTWFLQFKSAP